MAKQTGIMPLKGSIGEITFYRLNGRDIAKSKSSLNKERFYTDPAFERSRKIAFQKKITAPIAARVYHMLPNKMQKQGMIGKMIGEADRLFSSGLSENGIMNALYLKFCNNS
jgi:hypothetical protein